MKIKQCLFSDFKDFLHVDGVDAALSRLKSNRNIMHTAAFFLINHRKQHIGEVKVLRNQIDVFPHRIGFHQPVGGVGILYRYSKAGLDHGL